MTKYIKTATIEAEQFDGSKAMAEKYNVVNTTVGDDYGVPGGPLMLYTITTLEGGLRVQIGDWIATGVNGEHWAIKDKIFRKTYKPLSVIPVRVAKVIKTNQTYTELAVVLMRAKVGHHPDDYWIANHQEQFVRAWLDGYQIEVGDSDAKD